MEVLKEIVNKLIEKHMTISTMESCTGGSLAGAITNIEGASEVFKYGAVTYSNEFKIKIGVIASGDIFCTDPRMKDKIRYKFDADAIEMEGAAIAQVCKLDNIPFIIIRTISDNPNLNNVITYEEYLSMATKRCANIIEEYLK